MIQHPSLYTPGPHSAILSEYMLAANPGEEVAQKIRAEKEYLENKFGLATEAGIPSITIAHFLVKEQMEDLLCRYIQNVCSLQYSFAVALNNFSGFPPPAIFIRVQNAKPFIQLASSLQKLNSLLQSNDCPPLQLVKAPHMLIAKPPDKNTYEKVIAEYAQRTFHEIFTVNKLMLLKRESPYGKWQIVTHFYLPAEKIVFN